MSSTPPVSAERICRCGEPFPPDRDESAAYHSAKCANAHRQRKHRAMARDRDLLIDAVEDAAQSVRANRPVPVAAPKCDHSGRQPFIDGNAHICWRCGTRLTYRQYARPVVMGALIARGWFAPRKAAV